MLPLMAKSGKKKDKKMRTAMSGVQMCWVLGCVVVAVLVVVHMLWGTIQKRGREARLRLMYEAKWKHLNVRRHICLRHGSHIYKYTCMCALSRCLLVCGVRGGELMSHTKENQQPHHC